MQYLLNASQMKMIDNYSIEKTGIPSIVLMERAALNVTEAALNMTTDKDKILCVCGHGNNGADGLAVARQLFEKGRNVSVYLCGDAQKPGTIEFELQKQILLNLGVPFRNNQTFDEYNLIVDAIFGIGLSRDISGEYAQIVELINQAREQHETQVISVDIPSGINATNGKCMGHAVKADQTITFGYQKIGMVLYPGREFAGKVTVANIGFAPHAIDQFKQKAFTYEPNDLIRIPKRPMDSNKGNFGKVLIIAGSEQMCGAACLSAMAALNSGCGLVRVFTHENNRNVIMSVLPEAIVSTYQSEECLENINNELKTLTDWADCIIAGPGIGMSELSYHIINDVLQMSGNHDNKRLILDADALNLVAAHQELSVLLLQCNVIMTPHMGEMARLTGKTIDELKADPAQAANDLALDHVICVLKDAVTVVSDGTQVFYNTAGNCGMATAGSGDVLTGIIAGMLETGLDLYKAACMGVYVHACAGDEAAKDLGTFAMKASDIAGAISSVLR